MLYALCCLLFIINYTVQMLQSIVIGGTCNTSWKQTNNAMPNAGLSVALTFSTSVK